jgi:hypothetical protein
MAKSSWKKPAAKKPAEKKADAAEPVAKVHWEQDLNKHPKFDKFKAQGEK